MPSSWRDLALERGRRYLERCGVEPGSEMRAVLDQIAAALPADDDREFVLDTLMSQVSEHLQRCRAEVPPAAPPINRASMGYG